MNFIQIVLELFVPILILHIVYQLVSYINVLFDASLDEQARKSLKS